jgi:hypothetical protein
MERKGAAYHITQTRPQQAAAQSGGTRPVNKWNTTSNEGTHSYTEDEALALSVGRHPSGYTANVSNYSWNPLDPEEYQAGPFKTPLRAQIAAESLGERTRSIGKGVKGDIDSYRKPRY